MGIKRKLGIFIAVVLAVCAIGWGWHYGLRNERVYEQEAREAHADQVANGCYQKAQTNIQIAVVKKSDSKPCVPDVKAEKENDNRRDYDDLIAQRSSALWAKIMGIAALIGIGLSLVGVGLVAITFSETRKATIIARESMERQLRAYLRITGKTLPYPKFMTANNFEVLLALDNLGVTPAHQVEISTQVFFAKFPIPKDHKRPDTWTNMGSNVIIHKSEGGQDIAAHNSEITAQEMEKISGEKPEEAMYVAAKATYTDSFDHERVEEACFVCKFLSDGTGRFEIAGRYNSSS